MKDIGLKPAITINMIVISIGFLLFMTLKGPGSDYALNVDVAFAVDFPHSCDITDTTGWGALNALEWAIWAMDNCYSHTIDEPETDPNLLPCWDPGLGPGCYGPLDCNTTIQEGVCETTPKPPRLATYISDKDYLTPGDHFARDVINPSTTCWLARISCLQGEFGNPWAAIECAETQREFCQDMPGLDPKRPKSEPSPECNQRDPAWWCYLGPLPEGAFADPPPPPPLIFPPPLILDCLGKDAWDVRCY
jgi:hypothetical protein